MDNLSTLIRRVAKTQHGFTHIQKAAEEVFAQHQRPQVLALASQLFDSDLPQARYVGDIPVRQAGRAFKGKF